jgi:hypothetical protein
MTISIQSEPQGVIDLLASRFLDSTVGSSSQIRGTGCWKRLLRGKKLC